MDTFKVIVAGCRDFNDYSFVKSKLDIVLSKKKLNNKIIIISGTAKGVDSLGEKYANENNYELITKAPDWTLGRAGGPIRNSEMAKIADACIVFWDYKSRGSKNMIETAQKYNLQLRVIKIPGTNILK